MLRNSIRIALATVAMLAATPVAAKTFIINLTADPANPTTGTFSIGTSNYRFGNVVVDAFAPFTIAQGDAIQATLTLADGLVVPASMEQLFGLNFYQGANSSPPGYLNNQGPTTNGTLTFSYGAGSTGLPSNTLGGSCSNCLTAISGQIPGNSFTFDGLTVHQTITALNAPFTIDGASFSYQLRDLASGVPEPRSWVLMILGFGAVGGALRRRRREPRYAIV